MQVDGRGVRAQGWEVTRGARVQWQDGARVGSGGDSKPSSLTPPHALCILTPLGPGTSHILTPFALLRPTSHLVKLSLPVIFSLTGCEKKGMNGGTVLIFEQIVMNIGSWICCWQCYSYGL